MSRERWDELMARLGIESGDAMFDQIAAAYSETHRHYHTMEHIEHCLALHDEYGSQAEDSDSVELAIWFHDVIYKTTSKKNEEESAELARSFLTDKGVDQDIADNVAELILATRHEAPASGQDAQLLVDIDLAILGADETTYRRFEDNVRREYKWVPGFLFRRERVRILQSFLDRDRIYNTADLRARFEAQARENLTSAISELQ